jgi:hypothetical protein
MGSQRADSRVEMSVLSAERKAGDWAVCSVVWMVATKAVWWAETMVASLAGHSGCWADWWAVSKAGNWAATRADCLAKV